MHKIKKCLIKEKVSKYHMEIVVTILLLFNLIKIIPQYLELGDFWRSYILNYYVLSYQSANGFVSRGLVGTIIELFIDNINSKIFYIVFWGLYFIIYTTIIFKLIGYAKKSSECLALTFLGLMVFFSPAVMNYACDFARPDIFLVLIAMICMHLIYKRRGWIFIPILCIVGIFIHEGFVCFFMPIIGIYFLATILDNKKIWAIACFGITIIFSLIAVIYVFKYGKSNVADVEQLFSTIQSKIDIPLNSNMINFEFGSMKQDLGQISFGELSTYTTWLELIFYGTIFIPLYYIYFKIFKNERYKIKNKIISVLYVLAPFSGLLMIVVGVDYGRWFSMSITAGIIQTIYFIKEYRLNPVKSLGVYDYKKATFFFGIITMLYLIIGPMGDIHEHFDFLVSLNNFVTLFLF